MKVRIYQTHIELLEPSESQKDYLSTFNAFSVNNETDGIYRIYGDHAKLYTVLLMIGHRYSIEVLAQ